MASEVYASLVSGSGDPRGKTASSCVITVGTTVTGFRLAASFPMCGESVSLSHLSVSAVLGYRSYHYSRSRSEPVKTKRT